MGGLLALTLCLAGTLFLWRRDTRVHPELTTAVWIPVMWIAVTGSRLPSEWFTFSGTVYGSQSFESGNILDRNLFTILMIVGVIVLVRRRASLAGIIRSNKWLIFFFVYALIAVTWSEYPFVAFRRWVKAIGEPIMILVLLTEANPGDAITAVWRRCAYILIPLSIVFIRYFPAIGRNFITFSGAAQNTGVTTNKNALGCLCATTGLFLLGYLFKTYRLPKSPARRMELLLTLGMLGFVGWVLWDSKSSTSLGVMILGSLIMTIVGMRLVSKRFIGTYTVVAVSLVLIAQASFGVSAMVIKMLGRDETLTGRTDLWPLLVSMVSNPVIGTGYESFWLGERLQRVWSAYGIKLQEAHNGYVEVYLHLGLIGLFLLGGLLFVAFRKAQAELTRDFDWGRVRLAILFCVLVYNWTEAGFRPLHLFGFAFYSILVGYSPDAAAQLRKPAPAQTSTPGIKDAGAGRHVWSGPRRRPRSKAAYGALASARLDRPKWRE